MAGNFAFGKGLLIAVFAFLMACDSPERAYRNAENTDTQEAYETFIETYPDDPLTEAAQQRLKELEEAAFYGAIELAMPEAFQAFLDQYGEGAFAERSRSAQYQLELEERIANSDSEDEIDSLVVELEEILLTEVKTYGPGNRFVVEFPVPDNFDGQNRFTASTVTVGEQRRSLMDMEFPNDSFTTSIEHGSIFRIKDYLSIGLDDDQRVEFYSEDVKAKRLTFALLQGTGFVYLRGTGRIESGGDVLFSTE